MNNKIKIMTDSASDIPASQEEQYGIKILPFPITVGDDSYLERVDFTPEEFYDILITASKIPSTAQITMPQFCGEFTALQKEGYDEVIYVSINSGGSNTYNSAQMARDSLYQEHPDWKEGFRIHIVDSKTYCAAYGYAVVEAAKKAQKGMSSAEIIRYLEDWFDSVEIYFAPYTLEFVKKSGRVSCAAAFMGELIGLRPIISIIDGKTRVEEKVRGDKAIIPSLLKRAHDRAIPETPYLVVEGMLKEEAKEMTEAARKKFGYEASGSYPAGAAIAINAGPKIVAVIIKGQNRRSNR